jgi:hypothetical protein
MELASERGDRLVVYDRAESERARVESERAAAEARRSEEIGRKIQKAATEAASAKLEQWKRLNVDLLEALKQRLREQPRSSDRALGKWLEQNGRGFDGDGRHFVRYARKYKLL